MFQNVSTIFKYSFVQKRGIGQNHDNGETRTAVSLIVRDLVRQVQKYGFGFNVKLPNTCRSAPFEESDDS